jgi:hypothetical protein
MSYPCHRHRFLLPLHAFWESNCRAREPSFQPEMPNFFYWSERCGISEATLGSDIPNHRLTSLVNGDVLAKQFFLSG